jgi:hypothetical protein
MKLHVQIVCGARSASCTMGTGFLPRKGNLDLQLCAVARFGGNLMGA